MGAAWCHTCVNMLACGLRMKHLCTRTAYPLLAETNSARCSTPAAATDRDRDVSEKIALGLAQPSGQDMQFDQRLFNQTAGMDSGFGDEEGYNLYDKRLFEGAGGRDSIYRPRNNAQDLAGDEDSVVESTLKNARFKVDNEFSGASDGPKGARSGPVEFDKEDVFGLDEFMQAAKKGGDGDRRGGGGGGRDGDRQRRRSRSRSRSRSPRDRRR